MKKTLAKGLLAGLTGTLAMDGINYLLSLTGIVSLSRPESIGRIFGNWARGGFGKTFFEMAPSAQDFGVGLACHYGIGVALAIGFAILSSGTWHRPLAPLAAAAYGLGTSVFAWFFLFPSVGFGVFGAKAPPPVHLFRTSLFNHVSFGLGMALAVYALARLSGNRATRRVEASHIRSFAETR